MTNRNNSFMIKAPGIRKTFTKHPLNPKGIQSFRFSGLLNRHAMSVEPHSSGKGVNLVYRKKTDQNKPVKQLARIALIRDNRRTYNKIRRFSNKHFYRTDLKNVIILTFTLFSFFFKFISISISFFFFLSRFALKELVLCFDLNNRR